jgi:hypothetical protein
VNFLFLTSSNLATNPRLVKEVDLCLSKGHNATVVQFLLGNWSDNYSDGIKKSLNGAKFIELSAKRSPFFDWLYSSLLELLFSKVPSKFLNDKYLSYSISKRSYLLYRRLKKIDADFNWIIAHNPPAFYPAFWFSRKQKCKLGVDIEDYHPGEFLEIEKQDRMAEFLKRILPKSNYCSFASPLIQREVESKITQQIGSSFTILNSFKENDFVLYWPQNRKVRFIWYSQKIDFGRGLEYFLDAFESFTEFAEVTLIGSIDPAFEKYLQAYSVKILEPIPQNELHRLLSDFDVGLALEVGKDINNNLAISNKIISYAQAGIFIFSFETEAQVQFLKNYGLHSIISNKGINEITDSIKKIIDWNFRFPRDKQFNSGLKISWERVSLRLMEEWESHSNN